MAARRKVRQWELNDAKQAVADALAQVQLGERGYQRTFEMVERHNFWQDGYGWAGQRGTEPQVTAKILENVKPMFTPDDVVSELVGNVENGLLSFEPSVSFTPIVEPEDPQSEGALAQQKRVKALMGHISRWWDDKRFWERVGLGIRRTTWSGRAPLRLRINPANLEASGAFPTALDPPDAFSRIELDTLLPDAAAVVTDPDTERKVGIVVNKRDDGTEAAEVWTIEGKGTQERVTKCRVLILGGGRMNQRNREVAAIEHELRISGRMPVFELQTEPLLTEPMRLGQNQLNYIRTVLSRTVESSGFKSRFLGNVEPQLIWLTAKPTDTPVVKIDRSLGHPLYGIRTPWVFGAGHTSELIGLEEIGANGEKLHATPQVVIDPASDTTWVLDPADRVRKWLYKSAKQGHLGGASTAETSGDAYEQARAQHESDLKKRKGAVEGVVRDIIESAVALAALMSPELVGFLDEFRCVVNLHVNAGPIRPDTARLNRELRDAGLISLETAQTRNGIEDPAAELAALERDPINRIQFRTKQFALIQQAIMAGAEAHVACHFAGMTHEEIEMFITGEVPGLEDIEIPEPEPEPEPDPNAPPGERNAPPKRGP